MSSMTGIESIESNGNLKSGLLIDGEKKDHIIDIGKSKQVNAHEMLLLGTQKGEEGLVRTVFN